MRIQAGIWIRELKKNECLSEENLQKQTNEESTLADKSHYKKRTFVMVRK